MRFRYLGVTLLWCVLCSVAIPQTPNSEDLQALKDTLGQGNDQQSLLEGVLGKGTQNQKNDKKLNMPETVKPRRKSDQYNDYGIKEKTRDGRILRQPNEDPELRPDDTVMIELNPKGVPFPPSPLQLQNARGVTVPGGVGMGGVGLAGMAGGVGQNAVGAQGTTGMSGSSAAQAAAAAAAASGALSTAIPGSMQGQQPGVLNPQPPLSDEEIAKNLPPGFQEKPKTDEEKEKLTDFRKLILTHNPYKLNQYGVLQIPGLPAIPLAGLTAEEASAQLNADPDFEDFNVRLLLLRVEQTGPEGLKPFGYDLFQGEASTFAPVEDIQVPMDYVIGPGDMVNVLLYGSETGSYQLTVQRDGRINFPKLGPIEVAGQHFEAVRAHIEERVAEQLIGTRVSVTMGDLRSIRVFVLGDVETPGSYTVGGLSTMTNALFVSGGIKKNGSLRRIALKRDGQLVSTLDLYDLLLRGDTSGDRQLKQGDVIFVPPIGPIVSVYGSVRRPAIYELKEEKTAWQAVEMAGGLMPDADAQLGQLERILPSQRFQMENVNLTVADGRDTALGNGDKLRIPNIKPTLENSIKLSGYVYRPGEFEYHPGLRLSDIIRSFDELKPNTDLHYILIRRQLPPELKVSAVSADLVRALAAPKSAADPELKPRDEILVFDLSVGRDRLLQPILKDLELEATPEKPEQIVSVDGKVKAPGRYPLEPTMHVSDLIRAGGSLEDSAYGGEAELTRYQVVNGGRRTELIPVNLTAIRRGDASADLRLQPYDILVVKPIADWVEPGTIELAGEVRFPGKYPIHQGETLSSVLARAGGLTDYAFAEGTVYIRDELKKREKDQLEMLTNRLQSDLAALSLEAVAGSAMTNGGGGGASAGNAMLVGQQLLAQLKQTKPVGRLVIDINRVMKAKPGSDADVVVHDGDKLLVPKEFKDITILGEVQSPTSHVYQPGLTRDDYIAKSGGVTQKADRKRIYVVRANGDVISGTRHGWFRRSSASVVEIHPGDTIVVPLNTERIPPLPLWQSVTTIIYNLAVALLAVRSVSVL